jgi:hypothetical protein
MMNDSNGENQGYDTIAEASMARDEDRLPWLEAVDDTDADQVPSGKLAALVLAALVCIAVVVGGIAWMRSGKPGPDGDGRLIAAQEGDYKVRPDAPGGMKVEGQGDSAFAASEGATPKGKIDLNATTETPMTGGKPAAAKAPPAVAAGKSASAPMPAASGKLVASPPAMPVVRPGAAPAAGGTLVQLGAFGSEAKANQAWVAMTKRFAYLAPLSKSVEAAAVGGGTIYRLRANAGADATTVCGKLKVAGENCLMVK